MTINEFTAFLNKYDMRFNVLERNGSVLVGEIEFESDLGEDVVEKMWFNEGSIVSDFKRLAEDFDVDRHIISNILNMDEEYLSKSVRDLLKDAEWIKTKLTVVSDIIYVNY